MGIPRPDVAKLAAALSSSDEHTRRMAKIRLLNLSPYWAEEAIVDLETALKQPGLEKLPMLTLERAEIVLARRYAVFKDLKANGDYLRRLLLSGYETAGKRSPVWDADARAGLSQELGVSDRDSPESLLKAQSDKYHKAVRSGCDDPLVLYYAARADEQIGDIDRVECVKRLDALVPTLMSRSYPALLKLYIFDQIVGLTHHADPAQVAVVARSFRDFVSARDLSPGLVYLAVLAVQQLDAVAEPESAEAFFNAAYPIYVAARPNDRETLHYRARFQINQAVGELGKKRLADLPTSDAASIRRRLNDAQAALTRAWELAPDHADSAAATMMLLVISLQGGKELSELNLWFRRAIEANPDNWDACKNKLEYLRTDPNGSVEQMVAFGRECAASNLWRGGITGMLPLAYQQAAARATDKRRFLSRSDIWEDLRMYFETSIELYPGLSDESRSFYAKFACDAGQWAQAAKQFHAIGPHPDYGPFGGQVEFETAKKLAELNAPKTPEPTK